MKKLYTYNPVTLKFESISYKTPLIVLTIIIVMMITLSTSVPREIPESELIKAAVKYEKLIEVELKKDFNRETFIKKLNELNLKYPDIALAQAEIETDNFTSPIFIENNNLFGLRQAKTRPTTAKGTQRAHAFYNNWEESLYDYTLWVATYCNKMSRTTFLEYLDKVYAEAKDYDKAIEYRIQKRNLNRYFTE